MNPDDPRHGTNAGYLCHIFARETACPPCREGHATARRNLWRKRYVRGVDRLLIDATGTHRRIRALMAIGWRFQDIDTEAGHPSERATWAHNLLSQPRVHIDTAEKVALVFERLCMTPGPSVRVRNLAAKRGWAPPLAWDDIDTDTAPNLGSTERDVDPVVVDRLMSGWPVESTNAEKLEAMRRWVAAGGSEKAMCDAHGWRAGRYVERAFA